MAKEIELRILEVNPIDVAQKLSRAGAELVREGMQRRYVYDVEPGNDNKWMRLRDNGRAVELSVKEITDPNAIDGMNEVGVKVESFEAASNLLKALGFSARSYQENFRTAYKLKDVEVVIDQWPKLAPFVEIEGPSEADVYQAVETLSFDRSSVSFKHPVEMYADLGIDIRTAAEMRFDEPPQPVSSH